MIKRPLLTLSLPLFLIIFGVGIRLTSMHGGLPEPRSAHSAVLLQDGRVLVVGGFRGGGLESPWDSTHWLLSSRDVLLQWRLPNRVITEAVIDELTTCALYDPKSGQWSRADSTSINGDSSQATLLSNGDVLANQEDEKTFQLYHNDHWSAEARIPFESRKGDAHLVSLPEGKALLLGGTDDSLTSERKTCQVYSSNTRTWSVTGSLHVAHPACAMATLQTGEVMVMGGHDMNDDAPIMNQVEIYSPISSQWTMAPCLNTGRYESCATVLHNGQVLVAGGWLAGDLASCELFDPHIQKWNMTGPLNQPRSDAIAILLQNGKVLLIGGTYFDTVQNLTVALGSCELYDPANGKWSVTGKLYAPHNNGTATLLQDGWVLVTGGQESYTGPASTLCEIYDPQTGQWSRL